MHSQRLNFRPLPGFSSKHWQMILGVIRSSGASPPSECLIVPLEDGDRLSCEVSTPLKWGSKDPTVLLVHGLGGSHSSNYMIRMSRKLFQAGYKVVRVNLRGCGSGRGLSQLPYNAGNSHDLLKVAQRCKEEFPDSALTAIGFSLGGNVVLKLAGELEKEGNKWLSKCIAVCTPVDLAHSVQRISLRKNFFYHSFFLKWTLQQAAPWIKKKIQSIYELDEMMTAPLWGYSSALDYYQKCSSLQFLSKIEVTTHILFAQDDPFVDSRRVDPTLLPENVKVWVSEYGSHMGYIGKCAKEHGFYWLDQLLLHWVKDDFTFGE